MKSATNNGDGLPSAPTNQKIDFSTLRWLFVAPPGFGKSEFFSQFPDSLMLACEEGHKFITCHKIIIDEWESKEEGKDDDGNLHLSFCEAIRRIQKSDRFKFVFIDTLDALVKKCIDFHVLKANQTHLSELGDFGKGYDLGQNDPIRRQLNAIFSTGRGLGMITHQNIETKVFSKGTKSKKETTLPPGIHKMVFPQMDIIIHGEFGGIQDGHRFRDRIIKSEGSEDILAKNRGGILPPAWISPIELTKRIEQVKSFFEGTEAQRKVAIEKASKEYLSLYEK